MNAVNLCRQVCSEHKQGIVYSSFTVLSSLIFTHYILFVSSVQVKVMTSFSVSWTFCDIPCGTNLWFTSGCRIPQVLLTSNTAFVKFYTADCTMGIVQHFCQNTVWFFIQFLVLKKVSTLRPPLLVMFFFPFYDGIDHDANANTAESQSEENEIV